ncbi:MAG TPA: cytochrome ubiquinol oxidase subunit I [Candidatus Acidoferrum sp.]|nr:cytochrome ubiquinol oxidase subunit I [Candidatus Acidoferrum sp.]
MIPIVDFDRFLMAFSLGVHIILASIGISLPVIVVIAEVLGIRDNDRHFTVLARRLSLVLVVLFAVGTASGTLVALELFLLWPKFMALAGQVAILPVYMEVFAFFLEAIFLAIYIYSWDKFKGRYTHAVFGVLVAIGAAASGVLITMLNSFMNTPVGFNIATYLQTGTLTMINPLAVFNAPATGIEVAHVLATTYFAGTFIFCGYMAFMLLRSSGAEKEYYMKGLKLTFALVFVTTLFSVYTGTLSIKTLATIQPEKYAALEGNIAAVANAPEIIGGFFINGTLVDYLSVPKLQSTLLGGANVVAPGLSQYPQSTWPPLVVHDLFDLMVFFGVGFGIFVFAVLFLSILKERPFERHWILWLTVVASIFAVLLLELGWAMAEIARQPWIIYNVMLVSQAANYSPSVIPFAVLFVVIYALILPFTLFVLRRLFRDRPLSNDLV